MNECMYLHVQSPAKPVNAQLTQKVRELQQRVVQLEQERLSSMSRTDNEKELQLQVQYNSRGVGTSVYHCLWYVTTSRIGEGRKVQDKVSCVSSGIYKNVHVLHCFKYIIV